MTYVTPTTMLASQTVTATHWNRLVSNQQDMNTRLDALEDLVGDPPDYSEFPIGAVVAFYRAATFIPAGWQICDGTNSTPNLKGFFIYGCAASDDSDLLASSGDTTHTHTNSSTGLEGSHNHSASGSTGPSSTYTYTQSGSTAVAYAHTHTYNITTDSAPSHSHTVGDTGAGSSLPPYVKLYWITRTS
jgi:microcystin-dependent protein